MDGNTVALLVGRAELDRDTVRGAAGQERGGWDGWDTGNMVWGERSGAGYTNTVRGAAGLERGG